jgi:5-formyltetrahydrofolate cyclo-ligase
MPAEGKVDTEKQLLRSRFARTREAIALADRQKLNALVSGHLVRFVAGLGSGSLTIALYAAFRGEVDLSTCLIRLQMQRHKVVYPKTDMKTKQLSFYQVRNLEDLTIGNYGIYEPVSMEDNLVLQDEIDIVCVPGLAFTKSGIRLGYGGGFYDRLFGRETIRAKRIGIAYGVQVVESLPESMHDSRMDYLLTEEGWTNCTRLE